MTAAGVFNTSHQFVIRERSVRPPGCGENLCDKQIRLICSKLCVLICATGTIGFRIDSRNVHSGIDASPESMMKSECGFHNQMNQIVRDVTSEGRK